MLDTLTRRLSDYLIYVVEDYTSVDQRAVHRHSRALQESSKYPTPLFTEVCHFSQERDTSIGFASHRAGRPQRPAEPTS